MIFGTSFHFDFVQENFNKSTAHLLAKFSCDIVDMDFIWFVLLFFYALIKFFYKKKKKTDLNL